MSEILHKQNDHGMCEVYLDNGTKCLMAQDGIEYILDLESERKELVDCLRDCFEDLKKIRDDHHSGYATYTLRRHAPLIKKLKAEITT